MKKARLDQILLRMGAVSEEQIQKGLLRQKSRGGKLGSHRLPIATLTMSGANSAYQKTALPHSGQKCFSIQRPDSALRRHARLSPSILRSADLGQ